jgi:two-component system CheB/CheR fusion protein
LQSLNEELTALNSQLQETLSEHQAIANDLENTLNSADVATLFLDENLRIRFFTPAARALFSVITSDVGRPLADLARHFADGNLLADARMVLASLVPMTREIEAENGAWYTCRILPYRTKDNRIEGVVITFVDITTRKQAEEALDAARVQAETANLGKSRFLAAASHDLRQPLQTLSVLQGLLARKLKDSQELQFVVRIEEAVTAMSVMLNSLLNINQLEVGVIHPEFADFPINDLLERMTTEFAYQMESHGLEWRVIPSRLAVRSDPRLLEQMLRNLLSNAMKYTRKGGVLLGCRRRGDKLRIETWDTGLGIPQEQLPAIFQEFHQIDNPSREPSQGLGLGLAIVQRLGDLLGHTVDVRSRRGSGSVFSIEVAIVPQGKSLSPTIEREPVAIAAPGGLVLIIEDHPALRGSLEALMRADGYRTVAVADGDEAIEYAMGADAWPDIVIVDFNLPRGLTGPEVMARLREIIRHDLPALVLTGDISTETLTEIARQGYVHRTKPMRSDDLTGLIRTLLMGRSPAGPRGASRPPAIFVVDDDATIRESLREFIEAAGRPAEVYGSAREFFDTWTPGWNGCLVVDCQMPDMDGIELVERLRAAGHQLPAIMITGYGDLPLAIRAMKAGASSFIEKPIHADELLAAIDHAQGQALGYNARAALSDATAALIAALTPRERQVMDLLMEGKANKQMAYVLGISQRTVENHRAAVMKKFGAKSLSQLVRLTLDAALPVVARTLR